jgi:hypothetical protein
MSLLKNSAEIYLEHISRLIQHPLIDQTDLDLKYVGCHYNRYVYESDTISITTASGLDTVTTPTIFLKLPNHILIDDFLYTGVRAQMDIPDNIIELMGIASDMSKQVSKQLMYYSHWKYRTKCTDTKCKWCMKYYSHGDNCEAFEKGSKLAAEKLEIVKKHRLFSCYRYRLLKHYQQFTSAFILSDYETMVFNYLKIYLASKGWTIDTNLNVKMGQITRKLIKDIKHIVPRDIKPTRIVDVLKQYTPEEVYSRLYDSVPSSDSSSTYANTPISLQTT